MTFAGWLLGANAALWLALLPDSCGGWVPVDSEILATDHAGIVGSEYDPWRRRCIPATEPARLDARTAVARLIAGVASG